MNRSSIGRKTYLLDAHSHKQEIEVSTSISILMKKTVLLIYCFG